MRRIFLALLVVLVVLGSAGAAGAQRLRGEPLLTFYFWGDATEYHENAIATHQAAAQLHVQIRNVQSQGSYETGLLTRIAAHNGPDFFYTPDWWLPQLASKGVLLNLDPYLAKDPSFRRSDFVPAALEGMTYNGHLYGLPRGLSGVVVYYNKDIFDQMKVAYPSANWTMSDLLSTAQKLTTKDHYGLVLHSPNSSDAPNLDWSMWQYGGDLFNASKTQCTLDTPASQQGLSWLRDLTYRYHVNPNPTEFSANGGFSGTMFDKGKAAMVLGAARWFYDYGPLIGPNAPKFRWGTQLPPLAQDGTRYVYPEYAGMSIWSGTKIPDLAYKVGSAISQSNGQKAIAQAGIDMPVYLPALHSSSVFIAPDRQADQVSLDALKYVRLPRYVVNMKEVRGFLDHDLANFWLNKDTVQSATKSACGDINPLLK